MDCVKVPRRPPRPSRKSRTGECNDLHELSLHELPAFHHRVCARRRRDPCALACSLSAAKPEPWPFRNRFGSEYDRAVLKHGSPRKAEAKLADRETRVEALKIRDLGVTERDRFVAEWHTVQSRFVDHPKAAVTEADDLINALLEARGYPRASFEQRAADLSVTLPPRHGKLPPRPRRCRPYRPG